MREIIIPKNDDFRTVFNPVILITFSVVLNTIFQIKTSEEVWYGILLIYLILILIIMF